MSYDKSANSEQPVSMDAVTDIKSEKVAFNALFVARVKEAREKWGGKQREIASIFSIEQDIWKQYETRTPLPHYMVPKFCLVCGCTVEWLYGISRSSKQTPST